MKRVNIKIKTHSYVYKTVIAKCKHWIRATKTKLISLLDTVKLHQFKDYTVVENVNTSILLLTQKPGKENQQIIISKTGFKTGQVINC